MIASKRAEMGVGTLIVFIAMLLVAAVAAGVLIQTAGTLQEQSLATGQQARSQISTNARVIEVSGTDGRNGNVTDFQQIIKLSPGSDPIKLNQIIFTFNTKDQTSTLKYRGTDGVCELNNTIGYNTWNEEYVRFVNTSVNHYMLEEDLDDDKVEDFLYIEDAGALNLTFNLSEAGAFYVADATINLSLDTVGAVTGLGTNSWTIQNSTHTFAYVSLSGTSSTNNSLGGSNLTLTVTPYNEGEGYFVAIYEQEGTNHIPGNLQRGDVIRLCYEGPGQITEDEEVRLNFIPKIGTPTLTKFVTPDVISTERVYLYP